MAAALGSRVARLGTYRGDSAENLSDVQLVQYGGLAGCVQSKHDHLSRGTSVPSSADTEVKVKRQSSRCESLSYPHLFVPKHSVQHLSHGVPHLAPRILGPSPFDAKTKCRGSVSQLYEGLCLVIGESSRLSQFSV